MKKLNKTRVGENILYIFIWTIILAVPALNPFMLSEESVYFETILIAWCKIFPFLIIFLIHNYLLLPRFLFKNKYWLYFLLDLVLIFLVFIFVDYIQRNFAYVISDLDIQKSENIRGKASFTDLSIGWNAVFSIMMSGANIGVKLIYASIYQEQAIERIKSEKLQIEMDYLKYQLNPHFLMNTLNNIHALIDIDGEKAKKSIIDLSKMMRHVLYKSGNATITLDEDIEFLENYIELMKIRYDNMVEVVFDHSKVTDSKNIHLAPLLFIVFVENSFKHGVSYRNHSYINISIENRDNQIFFSIENSKNGQASPSKEGGIGLENVARRLNMIYGSNYKLDTLSNRENFSVTLQIPIKND